MSNIFTVALPYPMDKRAGNPMRQAAQGYTSYGLGGVLGTLACVGGGDDPGDRRRGPHEL